MKASLKTLRDMATRLGATITVLRERIAHRKFANKKSKTKSNKDKEKRVAEVLIRKVRKDDRDEESVIDLRLAVMGGQDAGKSTLLGKI